MYPLFVTETLGRFPGLTGLFIACILSATLSTFSSGVNSMATVILEDIYKRLSKKQSMSNEHQVFFSKLLCKYSEVSFDKIYFIICR
jgi:sodium-coupled monocarboxylate transporter 8/12